MVRFCTNAHRTGVWLGIHQRRCMTKDTVPQLYPFGHNTDFWSQYWSGFVLLEPVMRNARGVWCVTRGRDCNCCGVFWVWQPQLKRLPVSFYGVSDINGGFNYQIPQFAGLLPPCLRHSKPAPTMLSDRLRCPETTANLSQRKLGLDNLPPHPVR